MNATKPIRILIADDHPVVREGLVALLQRRPDMVVVAQAATGAETVALFRQHRPDITILDLWLPDKIGSLVVADIRRDFPAARIIILSIFDGDEDIYRSLHAGAQAYLLKESSLELLQEAIVTVHAGGAFVPPAIAAKLAERIRHPNLTPRELEVLRLIGEGKSNQEIASTLFIAEGTVKAHVNSILSKLGVSDRTQAVTIGTRRGFIHP